MKIGGNKPPEGMDPASIRKTSADKGSVSNTGGPGKPDSIEISRTGKEMKTLMDSVRKLPEVRTDKVNEVSKSVQAGTYAVNSQNVAEKMIGEMV